jgi:UDP-N-acetylmuramate dehydrogenase
LAVLQDTRKTITWEDDQLVAASGCAWDHLVAVAVEAGYFGLENLSGIPGRVGAAPIQNIGAYGAQLSDTLHSVRVFNSQSMAYEELPANSLRLGYRDSLFKSKEGAHYIVVEVNLHLSSVFTPNLSYPGLNVLLARGSSAPDLTALSVREHVLRLRGEKLPDPRIRGNVGSFFKNPMLDSMQLEKCTARGIRVYRTEFGYKASAAQMIERSGLKGHRSGSAKVSSQHALVIENLGDATYEEVVHLKNEIQHRVSDIFSVWLEPEPQIFPQ